MGAGPFVAMPKGGPERAAALRKRPVAVMKYASLALAGLLLVAATSGCTSLFPCKRGCSAGCTGGCNQCGLATAYEDAVQQYGDCSCGQCDSCVAGGAGKGVGHKIARLGRKQRGADGCETAGLGGLPGMGGLPGLGGHGGLAKDAALAASGAGAANLAARHAAQFAQGGGGHDREYQSTRFFAGPAGPPTAQITYPYYTTRGPRDFFVDHPSSIGP
jgi:hypothetical protein